MAGGQDRGEEAPVHKEDSEKMGFSSLPLGGMGTANRPGNPTPNPSGLVQPYHAGPWRPLPGLSFGLSLSPEAIAFTDLPEPEKEGGGGAREAAFFPIKAKSLK